MKKTVIPIVVALILAVSFILVANIASDTAMSIKNKGYVTVKGYAKQEITSDRGLFAVRLSAEDPDLQACYAKLADGKTKVMSYLEGKQKVSKTDIKIEPAGISEVYKVNERGFDTDEFVKYILRQDIKVESADVEKISDLSANIIELLEEGVLLAVYDPKYVYTKLEGLKIEMIGRATDNARQRALKIAKEGKFHLGPIASVRVGIFQITPVNSTAVSNYGINDTSSIDKEIKCVVEIQYFVK